MKKYETTKEALAAIYKDFGAEVLLGRLNAHLSDYAPSVPENLRKLAQAVHTFGASKVLKENLNASQENKEAAVKVAVRCLTDAFISKKIAEDIIFEFVDVLGWKITRPVTVQPTPAPVQQPVVKTQPAPQPAAKPQPAVTPQSKPVTPQPVQKTQPQPKPKPKSPKPSILSFFSGIFTIVDFDSGKGSTFIFGIIGGFIGAVIGMISGAMLGPFIGAVSGYIIFSVFIGRRIHVNLGKTIIILIVTAILLSLISTIVFQISSFFVPISASVKKETFKPVTATVITDELSMYKEASESGELIKTIRRGSSVSMLGETQNGWVNIKHDNDTGFVNEQYILYTGKQHPSQNRTQTASLINGTYTYWPRLQAVYNDNPVKDVFIPQIVVLDNTVIIYLCSNEQGFYGYLGYVNSSDREYDWDTGIDGFYDENHFILEDLSNPSQADSAARTYHPAQANSSNNGMGKIWSLTFNNIQTTHFKLTGKQYYYGDNTFTFDDIILGEPD